jgi:hypothetical protein
MRDHLERANRTQTTEAAGAGVPVGEEEIPGTSPERAGP